MSDPVKRAIDVLNEALEKDPEAIRRLLNLRVDCNKDLARHPTIQTAIYGGVDRIGLLGLLNGILGDSPSGVIGAKGLMDEGSGRFARITRFVDLRMEKVDYLA